MRDGDSAAVRDERALFRLSQNHKAPTPSRPVIRMLSPPPPAIQTSAAQNNTSFSNVLSVMSLRTRLMVASTRSIRGKGISIHAASAGAGAGL